MRHCTGERKICRKNHGAGRCLGKFSLLGNVRHLNRESIYMKRKTEVFENWRWEGLGMRLASSTVYRKLLM